MPEAEKFTDWACEILVSVRRTGSYTLPTVATELERERLEVERLQLATEQARLEVERERLALEREQFKAANSEETKKMAKAQLIRELASASGNNQSMRDVLVLQAWSLLRAEDVEEE